MGFFDIMKNLLKKESFSEQIPEDKKQYYQPDEYYTDILHEGELMEDVVISFDERSKTAIPSKNGLFPAEILLLEYCDEGYFPNPKNGYQAFWWFEYGIRNVDSALDSLVKRGFLVLGNYSSGLKELTVEQLKDILRKYKLKVSGNKAELISRISENIPDTDLKKIGLERKYILTKLAREEISENAYVFYMHKHSQKTIDKDPSTSFNIWSINNLLADQDKSKWKEIVNSEESRIRKYYEKKNNVFMEETRKNDPEMFRKLIAQDKQIKECQNAQAKYYENKDLDSYIQFWENLWNNGGLKFEGLGWHFTLAELYIKAKRYDDAIYFCEFIAKRKKGDSYQSKAAKIIQKAESKKTNKKRK